MAKASELVAKASKDFELAKAHKDEREYATAALLYNSAVEKVLKALFIRRTKKNPPKNASIEYLASRTGVPEEVSVYIASLRENEATEGMEDEGFLDLEYKSTGAGAERKVYYLDGLAKRLIDYATAYARL